MYHITSSIMHADFTHTHTHMTATFDHKPREVHILQCAAPSLQSLHLQSETRVQTRTALWCIELNGQRSARKQGEILQGGFPEQSTVWLARRSCSCSALHFHESCGTSIPGLAPHCWSGPLSGPLSCENLAPSPRKIPLMGCPHRAWPPGYPHRWRIATRYEWSPGFPSSVWTFSSYWTCC